MTIAEMEIERDRLYGEYIKAIGTGREKELLKKLDMMDEIMDAQEQHEEELEDMNESINWDEWMLDHKIDMERDREAVMVYEL